MSFTPHGKHLINGEWITGEQTFQSDPSSDSAHSFSIGTPEHVNQAAEAAEEASWTYSNSTREERAVFLEKIAEEIDQRGTTITQIGCEETGLPQARLQGERGRTTGQLRLFAGHIRDGAYLDRRHDKALSERAPLPRSDIKMVQRPIGPVAVFGASNFPLAFSTAGGDTAAALAAGCPVVVKGHSAHPGTGEIVAEAVHAAIKACDLYEGVFSFVQGGTKDVGTALVQHPLIKAVGFTGSLGGGRALFNLCASRPEPIPFFGELGSINPMFLLKEAASTRGEKLGTSWAGSLTMGAGQFCTNPGIVVALEGTHVAFEAAAKKALEAVAPQTMLTDDIAAAYRSGRDIVAGITGVQEVLKTSCDLRNATPYLYKTTGETWLRNAELGEEVFGPLGLIVIAKDTDEMLAIAKSLQGQLTCSLLMDDGDIDVAKSLMPILERKAGRVLANEFPTGVEVCDAMVHGGPYPASTNFGATSVGTLSIRRFLRPVCYQNLSANLVPEFF